MSMNPMFKAGTGGTSLRQHDEAGGARYGSPQQAPTSRAITLGESLNSKAANHTDNQCANDLGRPAERHLNLHPAELSKRSVTRSRLHEPVGENCELFTLRTCACETLVSSGGLCSSGGRKRCNPVGPRPLSKGPSEAVALNSFPGWASLSSSSRHVHS
jgi:hypothetical protein